MDILGKGLLIALGSLPPVLFVLWINHARKLYRETRQFPPPGDVFDVAGRKVHVYSEGEGYPPLVFMAGHGTVDPSLDFKPLWARMREDHRIVVVDRPGYGWSECGGRSRDIDTLLEETREALDLVGEQGPYVLIPHSMAGLEAIHWAQKYPREVVAVIGLDPCTPDAIEVMGEPNWLQIYTMYLVARLGLTRFMGDSQAAASLPLLKSGDLTGEEKARYLAVFYRNAFSADMLREVHHLKRNTARVSAIEPPADTPMYFFTSKEQNAAVNGWERAVTGYLKGIGISGHASIDTGHYLHYDHAAEIAEGIGAFIGKS